MPCTTILVGKKASYDGSTIMARNEDGAGGNFEEKKFIVVKPEEQPSVYKAVITGLEIELPDNPMRYTAMPNANPKVGIWGEAGFNEENVAMTETETITSNARVLGVDPLVEKGIGEEDLLTIVLPYIHSAREGVERLGFLTEKYGTYEMNGVGFSDDNEIWWFESIGGHHWIAKRVPDNSYVVMPNQQGIDSFDFVDAFDKQEHHMCSKDMIEFIESNHLDMSMISTPLKDRTDFDVRAALGSHSDSDHSYNTPRAWIMAKYLNPNTYIWEGEKADYTPFSDNIPWSFVPEHKINIEDVKYVLSSYYQGTEYNPYLKYGDQSKQGRFRPIGINRNNFLGILQIRPYLPKEIQTIEWIAMGSNAFNEVIPMYGNINRTPEYLSNTTHEVSTDNFYWTNRLIGALVDSHYHHCMQDVQRYQLKMASIGHQMIKQFDQEYLKNSTKDVSSYLEDCNDKIAEAAKKETLNLLNKVLYFSSLEMRNAYSKADA